MSYYDDDRSRRQRSTRERSKRDDYDDATVYDQNTRDTRIVKRRDDSVDSIEEVSRDFAPGDRGAVYRETTVRKSGHRPIRTRSSDDRWYDDRYDDRSYTSRKRYDDDYVVVDKPKRRNRDYDDRDSRRSRRHSSDYSSRSRSRTPPKKERRKSTVEEALGAVGLGGVAGALLGKTRDRSRSGSRDGRHRSRSRAGGRRDRSSSDRSRHRSKSRGKSRNEQISQAIKAAVLAGAGEAFRARKSEGGWGGEKGKRVLTAAVAAGGFDGLISNKDDPHHHSKRDIVGSALAGMATTRIVNGPRSKSRGRDGSPDSRGRSKSRGGLGDLAAGGIVAATAKKAYDSIRSRSRGRARSRSASSYDSRGSRSPPRKRSRSVSAFAAKGLAALGLKDAADKVNPDREHDRRRNYDNYDDDGRSSRYGGNGYNDPRDVGTIQPHYNHPNGGARAMSVPRGPPSGYELDYGPRHTGDPDTDSDSDLGSSSEDEKELKKGKKKMLLTGGLATVATIHAAHSVYQSMEKREARRHALKEGDISPEEAKKAKRKNQLQDVASIGIAALGLKGAYSEWHETQETRKEQREEKEKRDRHRAKREARRRKMSTIAAHSYADSGFTGSMPNLGTYPSHPQQYPTQYSAFPPPPGAYAPGSAVHYADDNPYGAMSQQPGYVPTPPPPPQMHVPRAETH
ncbi:hypothetical protein H2200_008552 [Cladophialophora chaetospira]|uniref:DUF3824 domain-containing protein n=1 Tax=Cladophialophora chaetospira TaxID=386627 RepID=A0AA38X487_9EURO|nr:hypothetical protein H2200_008552 [Cladophialophora chaetospira]